MSLDSLLRLAITRIAQEVKAVRAVADSKAAGSHTHDDRYYTEGESDGRFAPLTTRRELVSGAISTVGWYRIASATSRAHGRFIVSEDWGSRHNLVEFTAGSGYTQYAHIDLVVHHRYGQKTMTDLRIVASTDIYATYYLEIKLQDLVGGAFRTIMLDGDSHYGGGGWTLITPTWVADAVPADHHIPASSPIAEGTQTVAGKLTGNTVRVVYTTLPNARPSATYVEWVGPQNPSALMSNYDTWVQTP